MFDYFKLALNRYAQFSGRSRRSEYWYFQLVQVVIAFAIVMVGGLLAAASETLFNLSMIAYVIFALAMIIPSIAALVRRLHDTGRSGWYYFIALVPIAGPIVLLVWLASDGTPGTNQYGPNPKESAGITNTTAHFVG